MKKSSLASTPIRVRSYESSCRLVTAAGIGCIVVAVSLALVMILTRPPLITD
jgi:hypothetical protein